MRLLFLIAAVSAVLAAAPAAAEVIELAVLHATVKVDDVVGQKVLQLELTPESKATFADFTGRHVGETIDIRIDGEAVMSPKLMEPITGGVLIVNGSFAAGEVEKIAMRISEAGAKVEAATQDP